MNKPTVTFHERRGDWARQLRPRLASLGVSTRETRSADDLLTAFQTEACPIVVFVLGSRLEMLEDLISIRAKFPCALILLIDPSRPGIDPTFAREIGATHTLTGVVVAPAVYHLLERWLNLAGKRVEQAGWVADPVRQAEGSAPWYEQWMGDWA